MARALVAGMATPAEGVDFVAATAARIVKSMSDAASAAALTGADDIFATTCRARLEPTLSAG